MRRSPLRWLADAYAHLVTAADVEGFVRDYEAARVTAFTSVELGEVEAAVTYLRAYTARCEHAVDGAGAHWSGSFRELLQKEQVLTLDRRRDA